MNYFQLLILLMLATFAALMWYISYQAETLMPAQVLFVILLIIVALLAAIMQSVILESFNLRELVALTIAYTILLMLPPLIKKWLERK